MDAKVNLFIKWARNVIISVIFQIKAELKLNFESLWLNKSIMSLTAQPVPKFESGSEKLANRNDSNTEQDSKRPQWFK